jgi:hypothetical protein
MSGRRVQQAVIDGDDRPGPRSWIYQPEGADTVDVGGPFRGAGTCSSRRLPLMMPPPWMLTNTGPLSPSTVRWTLWPVAVV